jgi:hypothetical protein
VFNKIIRRFAIWNWKLRTNGDVLNNDENDYDLIGWLEASKPYIHDNKTEVN